MPGQFRVTFRNFRGLDLASARKAPMPNYKSNGFGEETAIRGALRGAAAVSSRGSLLNSLLDIATPPVASMSIAGSVPGARIRSPIPDFTVTEGAGVSVGAIAAYGAGGGVYYWNKHPDGEIGLFGSLSVGLVTNIGTSAGIQFSLLFGAAPSVLAGDCVTVAVDVGIDVLTVTGFLVLAAPPGGVWPPSATMLAGWTPDIIGVGYGVSVGFSVLPVDISVMPSRTWTRPIDPAHPIMI